MAFLLLNVAPDFVTLNVPYRDVYQQAAHKLFAAFPSQHEQPENRVPMQPRQPLGRSHAVTLQEHLKCQHPAIRAGVHGVEGPLVRLCEQLPALAALIPL